MRVSVVVFPGSNCDHDAWHVYKNLLKQDVNMIWHRDTDLQKPDVVILPGGFAYGDYLRTGALAKISPVMRAVKDFADKGGQVLGICNGFQILCEAGLLPGALLQNIDMKFLSRFVTMRVENLKTPFTKRFTQGGLITCPIAHGEGNYFADSETIKRLEGQGQVVFRYCDKDGKVNPEDRETNPNGAINAIAGICNEKGNVVGLMPHPERACEEMIGQVGGGSGLGVFG